MMTKIERQINSLFYERLLSSKNKDAVVRYTLPENETQVFASKYKLYLPTEEELLKELKQEYRALEAGKIKED